jgi:succinate dehydrogenase / fumarate reductase flavoprotein subunit
MEKYVGLFREKKGLIEALRVIRKLKEEYNNLSIEDDEKAFSTEFIQAIELGFMLDVAEVVAISALFREESRGAHYREDFPHRDDTSWLKHTIARISQKDVVISYKPVRITRWKPEKRVY